jgi:hypothetical protein
MDLAREAYIASSRAAWFFRATIIVVSYSGTTITEQRRAATA